MATTRSLYKRQANYSARAGARSANARLGRVGVIGARAAAHQPKRGGANQCNDSAPDRRPEHYGQPRFPERSEEGEIIKAQEEWHTAQCAARTGNSQEKAPDC